ncbi:hypothetical protein QFC22_001382 [Naganishia vaughanmartiniae]|uniref:Uncharacterized protein n=1 Tax=Naganishia vaughanmartiniae TaxID=1424756 RepID=A0ACC2XGN2_9TREE|nr:hypothetical protein QFC22_001382 [Naganishia vaughanmartiniae]
MEDAHSLHLSLPPADASETAEQEKPSISGSDAPEQPSGSTFTNQNSDGPAFFGVFDGHGGSAVARYTGTTIHSRLAALEAYKAGRYEEALKTLYLKTDEDLRADPNFFNEPSGCTAVSGLITTDGRIIVANSGDSRSVLSYKGEGKPLSYDHKPTNTEESARITAAGGFVEFGRVNGNLALSRAIGDFEFKQNYSLDAEHQIVTADPEIITHKCDGEEEFLVLACDGIWDCLTSQQVIDFVRRAIANGDALPKICEDLMLKCLAPDSELGGIGCDNMTVVIVALLNGRTVEEWQEWVKKRVDEKVGYDTPERVADVFGHAQAVQLGPGSGGQRQNGSPLSALQQVLDVAGGNHPAAGGDDEDMTDSEHSGEQNGAGEGTEEGLSRQEALARFVRSLTSGGRSTAADSTTDSDGDAKMTEAQEDGNSGTTSSSKRKGASTENLEISQRPSLVEYDDKEQPQLKSLPGGDEPSDAVKMEGLMDGSEAPNKM